MGVKGIWNDSLQCETCGEICHAPSGLNGEFTKANLENAFYDAHNNCTRPSTVKPQYKEDSYELEQENVNAQA